MTTQAKASADHAASVSAPEVFDYLDYRQFLSVRMAWMQTQDRKFSQRWLARRAGIKSPQLLTMIVRGQRHLNRELAAPLAAALKLDDSGTEYFRLIVDLAGCESEKSRQELLAEINILVRKSMFADISHDGAVIFREWYYPAVREIVTLNGFVPEPTWIAARLGIETGQASAALAELQARGFLKDTDGRLERSEPSVRTAGNKIYPMYLGAYHLKVLDQAFRGVRFARDRRHYEGLTVAVPRSLLPQIKKEIQKFFREIDALCEGETLREEVIQLHMSMFPLTQWGTDQESPKK